MTRKRRVFFSFQFSLIACSHKTLKTKIKKGPVEKNAENEMKRQRKKTAKKKRGGVSSFFLSPLSHSLLRKDETTNLGG
jgi:hypothetical protein